MLDRRQFLKGSLGTALALGAGACHGAPPPPRWSSAAFRKPQRSRVAVLAARSYTAPLEDVVRRGLEAFHLDVRGLRVVLKPNLVEFDATGAVNTQPALVGATIEVMRSLGAREVVVAEGPGHRRDNEYLLDASGMADVLRATRTPYVDLNTDVVSRVPLVSSYTSLTALHLPRTILDADLLVSMPKLKTHHWAGVTVSLKNMFGVVPGAVYGWPKNLLHWHGIDNSILDINAALPMRRFNIVDGIVGMEGNGPIQGSSRATGLVVFGDDPVAVDATCARLMLLDPLRLPYLSEATRFLGNAELDRIEQVAERLEPLAQDFEVMPDFQPMKLRSL